MHCPVCEQSKMDRVQYEGLQILQCPGCRGFVLEQRRLRAIEKRRDLQLDDLAQEIEHAANDTLSKLRCPKCRRTMEKRKKPFGPSEFWIDRCLKCKMVWLDFGELAKIQLIYEFSDQGMEQQQMQDRLQQMSDEDRKALEERIAKLPQHRWFDGFFDYPDRNESFLDLDWFLR